MTIGERLKAFLKNENITQKRFAREMGVNQPIVSDWVRGRTRIPIDKLAEMRSKYGLNPDWLLFGSEEIGPYLPDVNHEKALAERISYLKSIGMGDHLPKVEDASSIMVIGDISAGSLQEALQNPDDDISFKKAFPDSENYFAVKAVGDGMSGAGIMHNDYVICRRLEDGEEPVSGGIYVMRYKGDIIFKRVYVHANNYELKSENPGYGAFFPEKGEVDIYGKLAGLFRLVERPGK